jgi:type IX secretion system PorP/SprF family membrane protein
MAYDPNLSSGETFSTDRFSYADFGAGLVYTYKEGDRYMTSNDQKSFNYGFALYHLNKPRFSYLGNGDEQLYMRWSIFGNGNIGLGNSRWSIMPGIYYQRQKSAQELLVGTYFKCRMSEASRMTGRNKAAFFALGLFYRNRDALVAKGMVEWSDYSLGFAYDVNVSSLTQVSQSRGGVEIFLRYNMSGVFGGYRARI